MIIPYKVKNPPKGFPYATVSLIGLNILVYLFTSRSFLVIRPEVIHAYAMQWGVSPFYTFFTSLFLHGGLAHLLGNMLFLWIFGPAVEDRLRVPMYLFLYFLAGMSGHVCQAALGVAGAYSVHVPSLGASGCIMGVLGAYWYLFAWSPVCLFYWFWFRPGVFEAAAVYVIGAYFVLDVINGFMGRAFHASGGVANFAHVGGALVGALLVWSLHYKRDTDKESKVKAVQADVKKFDLLSCAQLHELVAINPEDNDVLVHFARKAADYGSADDLKYALQVNAQAVTRECPLEVLKYLAEQEGSTESLDAGDLIYLGARGESAGRTEHALFCYHLVETAYPNSPDLEMAWFRIAALLWRQQSNPQAALRKIDSLLEMFPNGRLLFQAEDMRTDIQREISQAA